MADFLTSQLPGTGGTIREEVEDFRVEEIPLYEPCGEGEHLYVTIEKRGLTTFDLLQAFSKALGCRDRDLGYAGLKDARAVTRQTISIPKCRPEEVAHLEIPGVTILSAKPHKNKLRPGHLAGNRFQIRIHQVAPEGPERARRVFDVLEDIGVPNRFGVQRYGILGNSHRIGHALLKGDIKAALDEIIGDPERIQHPGWQRAATCYQNNDLATAIRHMPRHCRNERQLLEAVNAGESIRKAVLGMPRKLLRLYLSAYQSSLFDRMVDMRLASIETLWPGDLAYKHANGACFVVEDPGKEQPRADSFEISPSAPLFGHKVRLASGQAGLLEQSLLDKERLALNDFKLSGGLSMEGERRPVRVPVNGVVIEPEGADLRVDFQLPKGSFATAVLNEVIKPGPEQDGLAGQLH